MPKIILIVEDYAVNRSFLKFLLEDYGYQVLEAANGQQAIDAVKEQAPDLILMDLAMPDMDGLTATKTNRELDGMAKLPIIAVTAYGKLYHQQAIEAGCDELINKPFDPIALMPILKQYL